MANLICNFLWNKRYIAFCIEHQAEILYNKEFTASNGITVKSMEFPDLDCNCIYLRGNTKNRDDIISVIRVDTEEQAIEKLKEYKDALREFVEHCSADETSKEPIAERMVL